MINLNMDKLMELGKYMRENAYDLNEIEFLSFIGTIIDEYCAKNKLDTNETWEVLNTIRKEVSKEFGNANYMNMIEV